MINKTIFVCGLVALSSAASNAAVLTDFSGAAGAGITYAITGDATQFAADDSLQSNTGSGTITFTFSDAVDFTISSADSVGFGTVFNGTAVNTFSADAGVWTYTAGALNIASAFTADDANSAITSSQVSNGGSGNNGNLNSTDDWGSLTISGVTEVTFDFSTGVETFEFSATPEPSSSALLGLGAAALLIRRRR